MSVDVLTFGCRLNAYESEVIRRNAEAAGLVDVVIVNTCAVTAEAERQARQAIRRARRERPQARIVVTGCAAQVNPVRYAAMSEVDRVIGNDAKMGLNAWIAAGEALGAVDFGRAATEKIAVNDIMSVKETAAHLIEGMEGRARAYVQVQNGCDHRCTFCIIPYGRGNSRSVPMGEVVAQARRLAENGYREVVLTGVDLTSYGADLPGAPRLGTLVAQILKHVRSLERLRLSSLDCVEIDDALMEALASEERLMPHLHLSLQSGDDLILKRMKRRHSRADAIALCEKVRRLRPGTAFGADLIAGFPTETEDMFRRSLDLVEECGLAFLHVFPYSPRHGTPAARMPQVARETVKERARRLRTQGEAALARHLDREIGAVRRVLAETNEGGHTEHFTPVQFDDVVEPGRIVEARMIRHDGRRLVAASRERTERCRATDRATIS
jgi:threonylcarbamoyladenosine tRNA methylthiotransferase MtaB